MISWILKKFSEKSPPVITPSQQRGGGGYYKSIENCTKKTARKEFIRATQYTADLSRDVSENSSINRGSQRQRWPQQTNIPTNEDWGVEGYEVGGDGAGVSHHGSRMIEVSNRWRLLWILAYVDV